MYEYFVISLLTFSGLFCGILIGYFAKEELDLGRQHFRRLSYALLFVILAVFLYQNKSLVFMTGLPAIFIMISLHKKKEILYYWLTGLILLLSSIYNGFILLASLIFLYGFPVGSEHIADRQKEPLWKIVKSAFNNYLGFILIQLLAFGLSLLY